MKPKFKSSTMTIRINPDLKARLKKASARLHIPHSEYIRALIEYNLSNPNKRVTTRRATKNY